MNKYFYSPYTRGFYQSAIHKEIPTDAIKIDMDEYHRLVSGTERGQEVTPGTDGIPVLSEPVVDHLERTKLRKLTLKATADSEIAWRQDAVDSQISTAKEIASLAEWKKYRVLLMRIDTSKAPDIEWPTPPVSQAS